MEETLPILSTEEFFCGLCNTKVNESDAFCDSCGYPIKGTLAEQQAFVDNRAIKEIDLEDYNKQIRKAGNVLYWIAGFCVIWGTILYATSKDINIIIGTVFIGAIFAALALWSRKKPLAAIISGASLYAILIILSAINNPLSIVSGIIWKILIIGAFIKGIKSAIEVEKVKKELNIK